MELLGEIAARENATTAQIALAWLLAQKPWIVPIPGTRGLARPEQNLGEVVVDHSADDLSDIENAAAKVTIQGPATPSLWSDRPATSP